MDTRIIAQHPVSAQLPAMRVLNPDPSFPLLRVIGEYSRDDMTDLIADLLAKRDTGRLAWELPTDQGETYRAAGRMAVNCYHSYACAAAREQAREAYRVEALATELHLAPHHMRALADLICMEFLSALSERRE